MGEDLEKNVAEREDCIRKMREWIDRHPDISNCRRDDLFLLRFLRTKKYSVVASQEMLHRYLIIRKMYPKWFRNLDVLDKDISDILDTGYLFPLPERDREGRRVIFSCVGKFDASRYSSDQMVRVHSLVVESLLDDPENQIRGYTHINDESGLTVAHLALWSLTDIRSMLRCIQHSTPMRHKMTHFVNVPSYANKMFQFMTGLLSEKLKKRVTWHRTVEELGDHVDPSILPKEYGGTVPTAQIVADFKRRLIERRESLLALDEMDVVLDRTLPELQDDGVLSGISGSFRKLEVD